MFVEISEYSINSNIDAEPKLEEYVFYYGDNYFKESISENMQFRESPIVRDVTQNFSNIINEIEEEEGAARSQRPLTDSELNNFLSDLMKEIPSEINWIDTRFYHRFQPKTRMWISVDTLFMPQSETLHCVVFHLYPPGGLIQNHEGTSGVVCKCLNAQTAIWMVQFSPNQTFIEFDNINEDSLLLIEVMEVIYNSKEPEDPKDDDSFLHKTKLTTNDVFFKTVGMSLINVLMPSGEFANGYYQLPIVKRVIDFEDLAEKLGGEATALDISRDIFEDNFRNGNLIENASILIRVFEESFEVR